jgi:hypothetical protein
MRSRNRKQNSQQVKVLRRQKRVVQKRRRKEMRLSTRLKPRRSGTESELGA